MRWLAIAIFCISSCTNESNARHSQIYKIDPDFLRHFSEEYPESGEFRGLTGEGMLKMAGFHFPGGSYVTSHPGFWKVVGPRTLHDKFEGFHEALTDSRPIMMDWEDFDYNLIYPNSDQDVPNPFDE